MVYIACVLIGIVAGLRVMTALATVSLGAWLGWIDLGTTWAAFVGHPVTLGVLVLAAIVEYITDQLPRTPSRLVPPQFATRIVCGGLAGLVLGGASGIWIAGLILGIVGAVIGTLGGAEARKRLAVSFGQDRPAAFTEDAAAIALGLLAVFLG